MMTLKPWGPLGWILPQAEIKEWHLIGCNSFEDRCIAVPEWFYQNDFQIKSSAIFRITNPPSKNWDDSSAKIEANFSLFLKYLGAPGLEVIETQLLDPPRSFSIKSKKNRKTDSVILDISTFPKRFFLNIFQNLINDNEIKNVVVTYSKAQTYPEIALCEDALPLASLPGFARTEPLKRSNRIFIGVGYVALSIENLMEDAKSSKLDFIFPFPPASPAYRRNWALLNMLMPDDVPQATDIHRVDGMDAFEVCSKLAAWGLESETTMIPLGPKPHALGMAMAYIKLNGQSEMLYAQPKSYLPNYSMGISRDKVGRPNVMAYFLKWNGNTTF